MSRSIDTLDKAVTDVIKDASGRSFTKDNLVEVIDDNIGSLRNASGFFLKLGPDAGAQLLKFINENRNTAKTLSMSIYNEITGGLCSAAQRANIERFLGAFQDTLAGLTVILEEINDSIDQLFVDKTITVYNTKISQVSIFGMVYSAQTFAEFANNYIALFMSDRNENLFKPVPATVNKLKASVPDVVTTINRVIGGKLNKSFVSAIKKYRNGGSDTVVVNSSSKSAVRFAHVTSEVTDHDLLAGAKGLKIFKLIGDFFVDISDAKLRKLRAERELLASRARLLQIELSGADENSPEYKRQVEIIKNYQKLIDRLDQKIAKYEKD